MQATITCNRVLNILKKCHIIATLYISPGDALARFISPLPICPGDTFTFRCTVTGNKNGVTIWRVNGSSECLLPHSTVGSMSTCGPGGVFTAKPGTGFATSTTFFSSTLSGTATSTLNGTLVECFGPAFSRDAQNMVGKNSLQILGQ